MNISLVQHAYVCKMGFYCTLTLETLFTVSQYKAPAGMHFGQLVKNSAPVFHNAFMKGFVTTSGYCSRKTKMLYCGTFETNTKVQSLQLLQANDVL